MDEFFEMLRNIMENNLPQIQVATIGKAHLILRTSEELTEEVVEEVARKIRESHEDPDIHLLTGKSFVHGESKEGFNARLDDITNKNQLTPMDLGIDYNMFGIVFVFKSKMSPASIKGLTKDLLDACGILRGELRAHFLDHEGNYLGRYEGVANDVGSKARNVLVPDARPVNRRIIQDSDITDLKIALNKGEERDCLDILEEIMKIGG